MAWTEQTGSHSWRVRFSDGDGKVHSVGGFRSGHDARRYAAALGSQAQPATPAAGRESVMLAEWAEQWLAAQRIAERTEENYRRNLNKHLLPRWDTSPLATITTGDIHIWEGQLHAAGYARSTVNTFIKLLAQVLGDAVEAGLLSENPVRRRPQRGLRVLQPVAERVWATPEQVVQVAENAAAVGDATMGLLIVTAAWTGLRWGELAGLQRSNVHLDDGLLRIDRYAGALHESGSRMWLGPPKTNASVRVVTLPPFLVALLREHMAGTDGAPVFAGPKGGWLRRSNTDRRVLRPATDGTLHLAHATLRLQPVQPGLTFHGFRHSHKTWLIADGVPEIAQARRLGHHLHDRIVETYSHVAPEVEQRLLDGLEARWHAANAYLHPRQPHGFRALIHRVGPWRAA